LNRNRNRNDARWPDAQRVLSLNEPVDAGTSQVYTTAGGGGSQCEE
jgi:hypothetical protein